MDKIIVINKNMEIRGGRSRTIYPKNPELNRVSYGIKGVS